MPSGGRDFLRLMNDQARRAADFDRRMRWSWLRQELRDGDPAEPGPAEEVLDLRTIEERTGPAQGD